MYDIVKNDSLERLPTYMVGLLWMIPGFFVAVGLVLLVGVTAATVMVGIGCWLGWGMMVWGISSAGRP